jgi:alpha-ketoglutarate-dependent taurine dioxygenase
MPKKLIQTISVESFESVKENISEYIDLFKEQAIVIFRGFKFSREQQLIITRIFGDSVNWYPNSTIPFDNFWSYEENHSRTMDELDKHDIPKNELFLPWHLEHMGHKNPAIGATWNMEKFTCEQGVGNTLFSNISDVYDLFSDEETSFLKKCKIAAFFSWDELDENKQNEPVLHDAVEFYGPSGRYSLRLNALFKYGNDSFYLHSFDGEAPSEENNSRFLDLAVRFTEHIQENEEVQQVHMWQENDLVVVDLFLMAHAVLGGFKPSERSFYGLWAHRRLGSKYD